MTRTRNGEPITLDDGALRAVIGGVSTTSLDVIGADPYASGDLPTSAIGVYTPPSGQYHGNQAGGDQNDGTAETDARHIRSFS